MSGKFKDRRREWAGAADDVRFAEPYHARLEALAGDVLTYIAKRAAVRAVSADAAMSATLHHLQGALQNRVDARQAPSQAQLLEAFYAERRT